MFEKKIYPWRRKTRDQIRRKIFKALMNYYFGATTSMLSRDLKLCRRVIREELKYLYALGKIKMLQVGRAKLYLRKRYSKRLK